MCGTIHKVTDVVHIIIIILTNSIILIKDDGIRQHHTQNCWRSLFYCTMMHRMIICQWFSCNVINFATKKSFICLRKLLIVLFLKIINSGIKFYGNNVLCKPNFFLSFKIVLKKFLLKVWNNFVFQRNNPKVEEPLVSISQKGHNFFKQT